MIKSNKEDITYSGGKEELIQDFINIALNIKEIGKLNSYEAERLCQLIPSVIKNEQLMEKKEELIKNQREEIIDGIYNDLNIRRVGKINE